MAAYPEQREIAEKYNNIARYISIHGRNSRYTNYLRNCLDTGTKPNPDKMLKLLHETE